MVAPRTEDDPRAVARVAPGKVLLVRLLNASYSILRTRLGIDAEVVAIDNVALGSPQAPGSRPFRIPAGETFELTSAQRYVMLVRPTSPGTVPVQMEFLDWSRRRIQAGGRGVARTEIRVG